MTHPQSISEISRFTSDGKTFFFNECKARNDQSYLGVNTIWGSGSQERLVIFPSQMLQFLKHFRQAVSEFTGMTPSQPVAAYCPDCRASPENWRPLTGTGGNAGYWILYCDNCGHVIAQSHEDAQEVLDV